MNKPNTIGLGEYKPEDLIEELKNRGVILYTEKEVEHRCFEYADKIIGKGEIDNTFYCAHDCETRTNLRECQYNYNKELCGKL